MRWELAVVLLLAAFMGGGVTGNLLKRCPECPLQPDCPKCLFTRQCLEQDAEGNIYPVPCTIKTVKDAGVSL